MVLYLLILIYLLAFSFIIIVFFLTLTIETIELVISKALYWFQKKVTDTRWYARTDTIKAFSQGYSEFQKPLLKMKIRSQRQFVRPFVY